MISLYKYPLPSECVRKDQRDCWNVKPEQILRAHHTLDLTMSTDSLDELDEKESIKTENKPFITRILYKISKVVGEIFAKIRELFNRCRKEQEPTNSSPLSDDGFNFWDPTCPSLLDPCWDEQKSVSTPSGSQHNTPSFDWL